MPRVSFALAAHGENPWLQSSLQSACDQSDVDHEVVLCLDRPSEGTLSEIDRLAGSLNFRTLHSNGPGLAAALNTIIENTDSEFVARLDTDDVALPIRSSMQIASLDNNDRLAVVGTHALTIDQDGHQIGMIKTPSSPLANKLRLLARSSLIHPSTMLRREALTSVGGYDESFQRFQDYDLWLRMSLEWSVQNIAMPLTLYRVHGDQASKNRVPGGEAQRRLRQSRSQLARQMHLGFLARPLSRAWEWRYESQ